MHAKVLKMKNTLKKDFFEGLFKVLKIGILSGQGGSLMYSYCM